MKNVTEKSGKLGRKAKISQWCKRNCDATLTVAKNAFDLADAVALGMVSAFAIHQALFNGSLHKVWAKTLLGAGVLLSTQAFLLLVKALNKKG